MGIAYKLDSLLIDLLYTLQSVELDIVIIAFLHFELRRYDNHVSLDFEASLIHIAS